MQDETHRRQLINFLSESLHIYMKKTFLFMSESESMKLMMT